MRPGTKLRWAVALGVSLGFVACRPAPNAVLPTQVVTATASSTALALVGVSISTFTPAPVTPTVPQQVSPTPLPVTATDSLTPTDTPVSTEAATATPDAPPTLAASLTPAATAVPTRSADSPTITETTLTLNGYSWQAHLHDTQPGDPVYPYPRLDYDPYTVDPGPLGPQTYKAVVLENKYVSLTFLPELGGRLYRWFDKTTNRQMLYNNPVIKATGFGVRGWWLSMGGLEWDLPIAEHGLVEWMPWDYTTASTATNASVIFSVTDKRTNLQAQVQVGLDATHNYFTLTPTLHNPNASPLTYQFWVSAIASPAGNNQVGPDLRFDIPASAMLVHSTDDQQLPAAGQTISWPVYNGRDMSVYGNWTKFLGLFASPGAAQPYSGLYSASVSGCFVRVFPPDLTPWLKLYGPGDLPAFVWTVNNGDTSYVELWGGLTANFNQDTVLQPDQSLSWTEYWYPFHGIGNYASANRNLALSVDDSATGVTVRLYTTAAQAMKVSVFVNNSPVAQWDALTTGPDIWQNTWTRTADGVTGITVADPSGNILARYGQTP